MSKNKLRIRSGDTVVVIAGKDRGKTGKVLRVDPESRKVAVEGVRVVTRHSPGQGDQPGGIVHKEALIDVSNVALWDAANEWIEMRLRATEEMTATVADLDLTVRFAAGEEMRTEISAKFRPEGLRAELDAAGFTTARTWTDPDERFALVLAERQ